ncbi:MAG: hypothetical protein GY796_22695 [Chloroflexi bacterium]|nr:hypothetical protein [Chloroflexota bacterium]
MSQILIIFIDSLPFVLLDKTPFLNSILEKWGIEPGFGYSVNIHAELFAGLLPDDIGYFGEWMHDPPRSPGWRYRALLPLMDTVLRPYILNRGLQHILTKRYSKGHPMPNIPLRHLDKFALEGEHIQSPNFPAPTLFTQFPEMKTLPYRGIGRPKGERDALLFAQGMAAIPDHPRLFVPLPDLDGFGHQYGIDRQSYLDHLTAVDNWCRQLSQSHQQKYPQGHIFIVSDHGMVNVNQGVYLDIEEKIGKASANTYLYFSDANLLRVWVFDGALRPAIQTYLEQYPHGQIVNEAERQNYGLTSPRFGDFIYVLAEKLAFQPSTFARNIPNGMHGYHAKAPHQAGIALHMGTAWPNAAPQRMKDVYGMMRDALAGAW